MSDILVMLQTNSNQPFIFSSPRLREQIGASFEITLLSHWVEEEAKCLLKAEDLPNTFWVSDSSGKVIVRFTQRDCAESDNSPESLARALIREVTLRVLTDAPGLDVTGVFITTDTDEVQPEDLEKLDREFSAYSLNRRPAAARFPQFPFLERADESALPASAPLSDEELDRIREYASRSLKVPVLSDDEGQVPTQTGKDKDRSLSLPSRVKRAWSRSARRLQLKEVIERQDLTLSNEEVRDRIADLNEDPFQLEMAFQDVSDEDGATKPLPELSSVGVIHIDGNGVGAIMRDLGTAHRAVQKIGVSTISDEVTTEQNSGLQSFIMEVNRRLDDVVKEAIALSWYDVQELSRYDVQELTPDTVVPIAPVLVGGDDVTVYTDGRYAIPFAEAYIRHYEELTKDDSLLSVLAIVAGGKKTDAPERDCFRLEDYIVQEPGPLTASAGAAIVGRNFPFHIAYDLAEGLVSRGKKLGKKPGASSCSTIDFHVLRDTTVLDPEDTLDEYEGRTQRPFLVGHYAPERIGDATTASSPDATPQSQDQWKRILQAVAAFDGHEPDSPDKTIGDPFPRARANRIVKLLAEGNSEQAVSEWELALDTAPAARKLQSTLIHLSAKENAEQVKWLLDLIDLSENLPDRYIASSIKSIPEDNAPKEAGHGHDEAVGSSSEGGDK